MNVRRNPRSEGKDRWFGWKHWTQVTKDASSHVVSSPIRQDFHHIPPLGFHLVSFVEACARRLWKWGYIVFEVVDAAALTRYSVANEDIGAVSLIFVERWHAASELVDWSAGSFQNGPTVCLWIHHDEASIRTAENGAAVVDVQLLRTWRLFLAFSLLKPKRDRGNR